APDNTIDKANPFFTPVNVICNLMQQIETIADEIGLNIDEFHRVSVEEIRTHIYWRHAYDIHIGNIHWPNFLIMPYAEAGVSVSPGKIKDPSKLFGIGFGNNGHTSIGGTAGVN